MVSVTKIMSISIILPPIITFIVGYMLIKYPISISVPTDRGMHKSNIASSGGIAILAGIIISLFIANVPGFSGVVALMIITITIIGYIDDKKSLKKLFRFVSQILISIVIVSQSETYYYSELDTALAIFSTILIIYTINIYNFMD